MVRLILVEDEFIVATDIQSQLRGTGYDIVGIAATGEDAIAQAGELRPDVVLMDIVLKGEVDGIDAAQQIAERFDIPVIFLTAHTDAATVKRATATASYGFLVKPFDKLELRAAIEMAIHRHVTEAKARESDRRIRELTESLSEMIFETDMAGTITFINFAGLKEFGYTKEQLEGEMTLYDFLPRDKHEEIRESIAQAVLEEPSEWIEVPALRRDGSTFQLAVRGSLIVREGVPVGMRGIALNVTEQKRAEQKLEESEKRIRELTDALPEIIFETDANGIVTFANAAMFTRYGWTIEEVEGKMNVLDVVAPFDRERVREAISKKIQREDAGWAEYTLINKDGSTTPFDVRTMPIVRDGVYAGLRGIAIDITERKRAEAALMRSERRIREITDTLPVVVYEADETSRITFANATAFDMFGCTNEDLEAGMSIFQMVVPADAERARAVFRRRMGGEDVGGVEYAGLRKDGSTFPISIRAVQMKRDGTVVGQRGVILDVTELKRAEERVKEYTHTIETLNRIMTEGNRATDVQSFAKTVTDLTLELLHFDVGTVHLNDYNVRRANVCYATGIPDITVEAIRGIPLDEALYTRVLVEGRPLFVDGHEALRVPHAAELGLASFAVVPLYRYDKRIGALTAGGFTRHTFTQAEQELLIAIGNEAGVVIAKLQADELIRATLNERETLLKEIHHRVKNNLQIVSSLLSLQAAQATEPETIDTLNESQTRIRSIALIHEKLYSSSSLAEIDFGNYVQSLVNELLPMFNVPFGVITTTVDIENVQLDVDTAIPCALIINELVSNSLKHAFPDGRAGAVTIALERANGAHALTVADNGIGFPADVDFQATDSLGMQLVVALVNQLGGTIELNRENGTAFVISFHAD